MIFAPVLVVGTGLIGTSIGLALRDAGVEVLLADADPAAAALAVELGAGRPPRPGEQAALAVLAVPVPALQATARAVRRDHQDALLTDVASVKVAAQQALEGVGLAPAYCGGHPVAGRERSGPAAARPDLFEGRPWVLTPGPATTATAERAAVELALTCGADVVRSDPAVHDAALGLVSHTPQLVASLLAARLVDAPDLALRLAGPGLRDTTRLAASDPTLWAGIVAHNPAPVREALTALRADLDRLLDALDGPSELTSTTVAALIGQGRAGRARLPGKHGVSSTAYSPVLVVVDDAPGRLADLLADAAAEGVNVEDLVIEHAPGRPKGVVELAVRPNDADRLVAALGQRGWGAHRSAGPRLG